MTGIAIGLCFAGFFFDGWAQLQASSYGNLEPLKFSRENLALSLSNIRNGKWWTLITYSFIHGNALHFTFNALTLWNFGPSVIRLFGSSAFVIVWLGATLTGAAGSLWWDQKKAGEVSHVGASGSIFAFTTMCALFEPKHPVAFFGIIRMPIAGAMLGMVALSIAFLANSWFPHIGHAGHLGGVAFGTLYYLTWLRRRLPFRRSGF